MTFEIVCYTLSKHLEFPQHVGGGATNPLVPCTCTKEHDVTSRETLGTSSPGDLSLKTKHPAKIISYCPKQYNRHAAEIKNKF